jgi:hypothetical protein
MDDAEELVGRGLNVVLLRLGPALIFLNNPARLYA